jgi:hypothetical protein
MNNSKERDRGLWSRLRTNVPLMMAVAVILLSAAQGVAGTSSGWYLMKAPKKSTLRDRLPLQIRSWLIHGAHYYPSNDRQFCKWKDVGAVVPIRTSSRIWSSLKVRQGRST